MTDRSRLRRRTLEDVFGPLHGEPRTPAQALARKVFAWYPLALCALAFLLGYLIGGG